MNKQFHSIVTLPALLLADAAAAHSGHGEPGTVGHDMQHQLWLFGALIVVGVVLLLVQAHDRNREK